MQYIRFITIAVIAFFGLLFAPSYSSEERVDTALKFDSGLLVKKGITKEANLPAIEFVKKKTNKDLEFILTEHRNTIAKLNSANLNTPTPSIKEHSFFVNNYLNKAKTMYCYTKNLSQLRVLII